MKKKIFAWTALVMVHVALTALIAVGGYVIMEVLYSLCDDWTIDGCEGWWIPLVPHCMWALAKARKALLTVIKG